MSSNPKRKVGVERAMIVLPFFRKLVTAAATEGSLRPRRPAAFPS